MVLRFSRRRARCPRAGCRQAADWRLLWPARPGFSARVCEEHAQRYLCMGWRAHRVADERPALVGALVLLEYSRTVRVR